MAAREVGVAAASEIDMYLSRIFELGHSVQIAAFVDGMGVRVTLDQDERREWRGPNLVAALRGARDALEEDDGQGE